MATHDLETALIFADKAAWMDKGRMIMHGESNSVIAAYKNFLLHSCPKTV
jgi:ABC-type polysaccharide/polyol phosphate transport system ATPase subunit